MKKTNWLPEGYRQLTPYLVIDGAEKAITFYKTVFDAKENMRMNGPEGKIGHAELLIGDSRIMLADQSPTMGAWAPTHYKGSPISIHLYVSDADQVVKKALENGATLDRPIEDKFYGDRSGSIKDPFGYIWHVSTHTEDLTPEEIDQRLKAMK